MSQQSTTLSSSTSAIRLPFDGIAVHHQDTLLLLGRLVMASIFINSGFEKLMALDGFAANLASKGVPLAAIFAPLGACVEFFGGLAVALGFASRASALLMIIFVIIATAISHRYWEFDGASRHAQAINFEKNAGILGGFITLFAVGAGRFSVDRLWRGSHPPA
ncbi:MAG: DoxX family protein [Bradyrhizobiaceae bacterium]|nr:DoxX family protein [Bradyrhizobiaceae bacterium]